MLRQRLLTALIGIPLGLAVIYLGGWYLAAVVTVIAVVGLREFYRLSGGVRLVAAAFGYWLCLGMIGGGLLSLDRPEVVLIALLGPLLFLAAAVLLQPAWRAIGLQELARDILATMAGVAYVPTLLAYVLRLRALDPNRILSGISAGALWLFLVVGATWVMDIAAYVVGKAIGRHKLCPTISPGKTIEGAIGGLLGAVAVAWAMGTWLGLSATQAVLLGALLGIGGQAGDLFESLLKRRAGVKDSGTLLPGHGGVLDRFDSLLFNAPIAYYVIRVFVG
jgi:phosphatidate cytidylyltransferase